LSESVNVAQDQAIAQADGLEAHVDTMQHGKREGQQIPIELVFGLVGPTGIDLNYVCDVLKAELKAMDYDAHVISLSKLLEIKLLGREKTYTNGFERVNTLMGLGTHLKEQTKQADILARFAIQAIQTIRNHNSGASGRGTAYIIRSFKRVEEVELFREIYTDQFFLVSIYSSRRSRIDFLKRNIGSTTIVGGKDSSQLADELIKKDYAEAGVKNGQQVGKTFPRADYFVSAEPRPQLANNLRRLVRLAFGDPYISPTAEEQGMFFAQAAGLRSLDLSRQVGAAVLGSSGEIKVTGCNEVPRKGGGLYWADDPNVQRDVELGYDANVVLKRHILEDTIARFRSAGWTGEDVAGRPLQELLDEALLSEDAFMESSTFYDVIEFGRAVHAEMAAISEAARAGVSLQNGRLFCTTFPCHICARHIVAAGIKEVYFIEPYEKSRVKDLYSDSIEVEPAGECVDKVAFKAFVGVAPRRYIDFFQARGGKKNADGTALRPSDALKYKKVRKKIFHIPLLEKVAINEIEQFSPYPQE
jgi:cytidine deaminase